MYSGGQRISPGNRTQSRQLQRLEGSSPARAKASGMGHHRDLRSGHVFRGVIRELGRTSRLLGSQCRSTGDRLNQHPGVRRWMRAVSEPSLAASQAEHETQRVNPRYRSGAKSEPTGTDEGSRSDASTAGSGAARLRSRKRGELRPKGPTIQAERRREGEAGHDLWARERQERP